jgi:sulfide:quinone oxidoreductase
MDKMNHRVVIVGGGSAGISVASRLLKAKQDDIAIIEPSDTHYYQPLWTLVGGGRAPVAESMRPESKVMPRGVRWIQDHAVEIDPEKQQVHTKSGAKVGYDFLVMAAGIQLDWDRVPGISETLGRNGVSSNYLPELATRMWSYLKDMKGGTALFTMPSGPIKCAGAPQKIAYLAADWFRIQGVLKNIKMVLAIPTPKLFGVPEFNAVVEKAAERYGIEVLTQHEVVEVNPDTKEAIIVNRQDGRDDKFSMGYDVMHFVPPQSAPDWIKHSPLADPANPGGYVKIDKETMQHTEYPNVFALGDCGSSPNSKTGAAVRKQAPVVVANIEAAMSGRALTAKYDGYASCPLVTARNRMCLAEFDYTMKPHPTFPVINLQKERYDMWLLKRYGLPFMYWNLMLKGMA